MDNQETTANPCSQEVTAYIYSIQRYCIHDGPGIRTTIFFKGCSMHCGWCANPESKNADPEIAFFSHKCKQCGRCAAVCQPGAIDLASDLRIDRTRCNFCGDCVHICPNDAYRIFGETIPCEKLVDEVLKDRKFYRKSGGGITVSGGEPSLQIDFLEQFLHRIKQFGIHTAMETNGDMTPNQLERLAQVVDLFLYDVKHMDTEQHEECTGVPNKQVLANIRRIAFDLRIPVALRLPVIPGFNDDEANLNATVKLARELAKGSLTGVHILKFHSLATAKYEALGLADPYARTNTQTNERLEQIKERFEAEGVITQIGG